MVTVDDATYVKMKDTLYWGDAWAASKAKAKIESSYTQQQYDNLVSKLGGMWTTQQTTPKPSNMDAGNSTIQQTTTPSRNMQTETPVKQQETTGNTVWEIQQQGALKPLSQDYYNQTWDDAQNKIRYNLNQYRQSNPWLFSTYEDFKKNFSYDARNDEQKQTLDSWYGEYQKWMEYWAIPTADLYTQYKDWSISTSDLEILKTYNPEKYTELQAQINKWNIIQAYDDTAPAEKQDFQDLAYQYASELFKRFMNWDGWSEASKFFDEYKANMDSPEMMELQDKQTDLVEQGKNIQDQIFSIQKDVEKEYEWTWATKSKINAIIADRTYDLQQQLRTINNEYEKYATQYNNRATQYQNEFQLQLQEYQVNMQARNQQMSELWFAMDLMNFETNEQKAQREWDYWVKQQEYTNWNINSKEYDTRYKAALKSVQNLLSQYEGIPMQRSAEQMAQDVLKAIDWGSNLWAELTKINKQIQGKKEYKMMYNQTFKNPDAWITWSYTIGDQQYVVYNGKLMSADDFNKTYWNVNADWKSTTYWGIEYTPVNSYTLQWELMDFANNHAVGTTWGWCGKFVNDYLQSIWLGRLYGDSISSKTKTINTDKNDLSNLSIGSVAVFDYSNSKGVWENARNYGHVAIVSDIDLENGRVKLLESNYSWDKKVTNSRWINVDKSGALKGFFDPSKWSVSVSDTTTTDTLTTTKLPWWLTEAWVTQLAKDMLNWEKNYSEIKSAYGDDGLNVIENKMLELQANWFERSTKITDPNKIMNAEQNLMTKFNSMNDGNKTALKRVNIMNEALNSIASDKKNDKKTLNWASQAIVNAYNKILDEKSVVRESEYARTPEWQAYFDKLQWKLEQFTKWWAWLTYDNLKWLVDLANNFADTYQTQQDNLVQLIRNQADTYGLNINNILPMEYLTNWTSNWTTSSSNTWQSTQTTSSTGWVYSWYSTLPQTTTWNVTNTTANVWGFYVPTNFYQK